MEQNRRAIQMRMNKQMYVLCSIIDRELPTCSSKRAKPERISTCPHCGSENSIKRGFDTSNRQRFYCKDCDRSYTRSTGGEFSSTNLGKETWVQFAQCYLEQLSLRESAARCDVSLKTAFHMRKRLETAIHRYALQIKEQLENMSIDRSDNRRTIF